MGIHRTIDEMIDNLYLALLDKKGFTVFSDTDMLTWRHFSYGWGWGVSIAGLETVVAAEVLTLPVFNALMREYHRLQQGVAGSFIGVWYDEEGELIYFDITKIHASEEIALAEAVAGGQVAYFDYETMEVVKVELAPAAEADEWGRWPDRT